MKNLIAGLIILASSLIQQSNLQVRSRHSSIISVISLILETISMYLLPLSNYTLLSSLHLISSSLIYKHIHNTDLTFDQTSGNLFILSGCFVSVFFCSSQEAITESSQLSIILNPFFSIWLSCNLLVSFIFRYKGWYIGKALIESSIPSQICTLSLISLKVLLIECEALNRDQAVSSVALVLCSLVWPLGFLCTSSFIRYLSELYDPKLLAVGYYLWFLFNCFPVGITVIRAGTVFSSSHISALLTSASLVAIGCYFHARTLKDRKGDKDNDWRMNDKEGQQESDEERLNLI